MANSRTLEEAVNRLSLIRWTEDIMLRTLRNIALDNPAAFLAAVNVVEAQDKESQAMCSAGFVEPDPVVEQLKPVTYTLKIIFYATENKIKVLKAYRDITGLDLIKAKKHIDFSYPIFICSGNIDRIKAARSALELAGAICLISSLKPC
jgi:ribosomal protein L7/L12